MSPRNRAALCAGACLALNAHPAGAAHVHGEGRLDLAVDALQLSVQLTLPGDTAVGFESAPQDDAQRQAVQAAVRRFSTLSHWLVLPTAAGCSAGDADVNLPEVLRGNGASGDESHPQAGGHGAREDEHRDHGDHDDDHGHDDHDDHEAPAHDHDTRDADWKVFYEIACSNPSALSRFDLGPLFEALPRLETLRIQYIGPAGQAGGELTPAERIFEPAR